MKPAVPRPRQSPETDQPVSFFARLGTSIRRNWWSLTAIPALVALAAGASVGAKEAFGDGLPASPPSLPPAPTEERSPLIGLHTQNQRSTVTYEGLPVTVAFEAIAVMGTTDVMFSAAVLPDEDRLPPVYLADLTINGPDSGRMLLKTAPEGEDAFHRQVDEHLLSGQFFVRAELRATDDPRFSHVVEMQVDVHYLGVDAPVETPSLPATPASTVSPAALATPTRHHTGPVLFL